MSMYEKACEFLKIIGNLGIIWGNLDTNPDNKEKKANCIKRFSKAEGLTVDYVDGVYDAMNQCGSYKIVKSCLENLEKLGIKLQNLNQETIAAVRRKLYLEEDYFQGIFDAIIEKQKLQSSDTSEKNNQGDKGDKGDEGKEDDEFVQ